jgi:hypothetical protein
LDGTADLLVLFQDGQPVFSKWAHPVTAAAASSGSALTSDASPRTADDRLAPLEDPFRADFRVNGVRFPIGAGNCVGLPISGGLPVSCDAVASPLTSSSDISGASVSRPPSATVGPFSPRGPPVPVLLT